MSMIKNRPLARPGAWDTAGQLGGLARRDQRRQRRMRSNRHNRATTEQAHNGDTQPTHHDNNWSVIIEQNVS
jgi:hypothetical protein